MSHRTQSSVSIILIEDNKYIADSWSAIINFEPDLKVIHHFTSVEEALASTDAEIADIAILDIELPGMSGVDGVIELKKVNHNLLIIMATVHEENENIFNALRNGAIGYLSKKVSTTELIQSIRSAIDGGSPMTPSVARKVIQSFQPATSQNEVLTKREIEILQFLADGKSYAAIAKSIFLSVDGVGYHVRHIYQKLQVNSRGEAVREGLRMKLIKMFR